MPDQTATTLFFVIRRIYQTRSVIVAAPQKAAGRREAKSVKPKRLYEMDMSQYTMAGLSNQNGRRFAAIASSPDNTISLAVSA